jgi:hypothetical protein
VVSDQPDVATFAAITPVRTTHDDGAFTAKRDTARATIPTAYVELAFIDEL